MSENIKPFIKLQKNEKEMSKNEIAAYLEMYYIFNINIVKNPSNTYFNNFKTLKNKYISLDENENLSNIIREANFYTEYDYMIQIAKIYTLNKFFSYYVDSNLHKTGEVGEENVDDKYFVDDSTKYNVKDTINYIRNAFNHNDKEKFQLFRLIQKQNDPNIYIEFFLRKPNFHIMLTVDDLLILLTPVLSSKSFYNYLYYDENGKIIQTPSQFEKNIDKKIIFEIKHFYDFENDQLNKYAQFNKKFEFSKDQLDSIKNNYKLLKTDSEFTNSIIIPRIMRNSIPFGMAKVEGYCADINYFFCDLFNLDGCYFDWEQKIYKQLKYDSKKESINSFETQYYVLDKIDRVNRAFLIFASYILDTIIPEKTNININGQDYLKENIRNSLVHGTYFNYIPSDTSDSILYLYDYRHKNKKGLTDNNLILEDSIINKFKILDIYESLLSYIKIDDYSLPLDIIIDLDRFNGFCLTFKEDYTRYYVNASFNNKTPIFLGVKDIDGIPFYMDDKDFILFKDKVLKMNFNELKMFEEDIISFIKRIPEISMKATQLYIKLCENKNLSRDIYYETLKNDIDELKKVCANYFIIPQTEIMQNNDQQITIYKY